MKTSWHNDSWNTNTEWRFGIYSIVLMILIHVKSVYQYCDFIVWHATPIHNFFAQLEKFTKWTWMAVWNGILNIPIHNALLSNKIFLNVSKWSCSEVFCTVFPSRALSLDICHNVFTSLTITLYNPQQVATYHCKFKIERTRKCN